MTAFAVRLMFVLTSLFAASILLTRLEPHNDLNVSSLLISDDCAPPCFLGIKLGETTVDDAVKILRNHAWVQDVESRYTDFGQSTNTFWGYVYWQWKGDSPLWTHTPTFKIPLHDAYLRIIDGRVNEISFSTSLALGAVVLSTGQIGRYVLDRPDRYGEKPYPIIQHFYFPKLGLAFGSISVCPTFSPDWHQDTVITVWSAERFAGFMQMLPLVSHPLPEARIIARMECK